MHHGPRPTFQESDATLEVHLFDVDVDLYSLPVKISWIARLRDVMSFPDVTALKAQLGRDRAAAQNALTASVVAATD